MGDDDTAQEMRSALKAAHDQLELAAEHCAALAERDRVAGPRNYRAAGRNIKHARKFVLLALDETPVDTADGSRDRN